MATSFVNYQEPEYWTDVQINNNNDMTINKIRKYKDNDINVNLFIGRNPTETLPERKTNDIWISLSCGQLNESLQHITEDRLHLIMDCNKTTQMKTIQGLFNLVVVDLSTRKFFEDQGLSNIYDAVQKRGELLIETCLFGGTIKIVDESSFSNDRREYSKRFKTFVVKFFQEQFNVSLDTSFRGNIMDSDQIYDNENLISNIQEYKDWKVNQGPGYIYHEMADFFRYLAEKQGIIDPASVLSREQKLAEIKTRTSEMLQCFDQVEFIKGIYPYKNNYDDNGQIKREYFHVTGKK